jgi:hypothetical protein
MTYNAFGLKQRLWSINVVISTYFIGIILMETKDLLLHQIIKSSVAQHPEKVTDNAINLWEQMATHIITIVGEAGFDTLYARSVFLTQSTFPWLAADSFSAQTDHRFAKLKMSLEGQTPEQASEANSLLLITFADILASLIGEELTTRILCRAWGYDASKMPGKEFQNE